jgi:hypothetical protein
MFSAEHHLSAFLVRRYYLAYFFSQNGQRKKQAAEHNKDRNCPFHDLPSPRGHIFSFP